MVDRYVCTADAPWSKDKERFALHPDAVYLYQDDHDDGSCEVFKCPHCGLRFHVEMPD